MILTTAEATTESRCSRSFSQNNGRWSQNTIFPNNTDAISAETLFRTTADVLKNNISNNTDAITAEALTRACK
jgi:hypothetical protein